MEKSSIIITNNNKNNVLINVIINVLRFNYVYKNLLDLLDFLAICITHKSLTCYTVYTNSSMNIPASNNNGEAHCETATAPELVPLLALPPLLSTPWSVVTGFATTFAPRAL